MPKTVPVLSPYTPYQIRPLQVRNHYGGQMEVLSDSVSQENLSDENFTNLMKATASIVS